jgi:hypothetical protein
VAFGWMIYRVGIEAVGSVESSAKLISTFVSHFAEI